ncbi:MAG: glutamate synthase subunit beta [Spirochaetales bacterium]|jgi:glutamate synthase (NADPH) small chain|nr:glutamate synthase subunit beta [Spirochaetales bacterium]
MGKPTGFIEYTRIEKKERSTRERVGDYREIPIMPDHNAVEQEGARCMDCGIPYCHSIGCPVVNLIPEWNDAVYKGQWREAWERLELTNNLPEVTGRVCPAPCETACTLAINTEAVSIKKIELAIVEKAFEEGWVIPRLPKSESGKRVAVVGSGPAGLAAAQQLRRMGHRVSLFEKADKIGGLLRYGIPDFKLEKHILDRRIEQMVKEGVEFETGVTIGDDLSARYLRNKFDVVLLTLGAGAPRDLPIAGRDLGGVYFAMNFLSLSNRFVSGDIDEKDLISAKGKNVLVIGGGDTGSDCVGTSIRQGAKKVRQIEIMPKPLDWDQDHNPEWPNWPSILRTSTSHEEGCERDWCINSQEFTGKDGHVTHANCSRIEWRKNDPALRPEMIEIQDSEFTLDADLVLLAMGFIHVAHSRLTDQLGVKFDSRGNIETDGRYRTSIDGVFAAGDANTGASLVVRAINHGRHAADAVTEYLEGI